MIEIRELIIRGKVNGEFDSTSQDIAKIIDQKIDEKLSQYNAKLSKSERKSLINQCINELYEKIDFESRI